jgi:hypothetical protein
MAKSLRFFDELEVDPLSREDARRTIATIALLDRVLAPALRCPLHLVSIEHLVRPIMSDEDYDCLKHRRPIQARDSWPSVSQQILELSSILAAVCHTYRIADSGDVSIEVKLNYQRSLVNTDPSLAWNEVNLERHQDRDSLRRFAFMHCLFHHVGQLIYFRALGHFTDPNLDSDRVPADVTRCHEHARAIPTIVEYIHRVADFDLHNYCMGQVLIVSSVVHTHELLLCSNFLDVAADVRRRMEELRTCVRRIKRFDRLFVFASHTLESFLALCNQSDRPLNEMIEKDPALLGTILQLGSQSERLDLRTAGRMQGLESLLRAMPGGQPSPISAHSMVSPFSHQQRPSNEQTVIRGHSIDLSNQNWALDNLAWAWSNESLHQLYTMPNA